MSATTPDDADDGDADYGCDGKHRFGTRAQAQVAAAKARRHPRYTGSRGRIQSYRCRRCGGWHIGAYAVRKPLLPRRLRLMLRTLPRRFDWRRALATLHEDG